MHHLLQWQSRFLFRSSSNQSSILYILTGKDGNVGRPDFILQIFIFMYLHVKICTHSFVILTKTLQGQWNLFKTECANQLSVPKKCESKICNLLNWDSKSGKWYSKGGCTNAHPCALGSTTPALWCLYQGRWSWVHWVCFRAPNVWPISKVYLNFVYLIFFLNQRVPKGMFSNRRVLWHPWYPC